MLEIQHRPNAVRGQALCLHRHAQPALKVARGAVCMPWVCRSKRERRDVPVDTAPARPVAKGRWHGHLPASGHGMTADGKLLGCLLVSISLGWSQNVAKNNTQPMHTWMKTNIIDQTVLRAFWIDAGFCCTNIWGHQRQADTWQEESLQPQWHRAAHICSVLCGDFSAAASQGLLRAQHTGDWRCCPASLLSATSEEHSTLSEALTDGSRQGSDSKFLLRWGTRAYLDTCMWLLIMGKPNSCLPANMVPDFAKGQLVLTITMKRDQKRETKCILKTAFDTASSIYQSKKDPH